MISVTKKESKERSQAIGELEASMRGLEDFTIGIVDALLLNQMAALRVPTQTNVSKAALEESISQQKTGVNRIMSGLITDLK